MLRTAAAPALVAALIFADPVQDARQQYDRDVAVARETYDRDVTRGP